MKGIAYYHVMYPGFITLPDGFNCFFKHNDRLACVLIVKKYIKTDDP